MSANVQPNSPRLIPHHQPIAALHELPLEIMTMILRLLGSSFFRSDVRCLSLSKWWYLLARPVFLQDLHLSARSLRRLYRSPHLFRMFHPIRYYARTLTLDLEGFDRWDTWQLQPDATDWTDGTYRENLGLQNLNFWTVLLNDRLMVLAENLRNSRHMLSLKFVARSEEPMPHHGRRRQAYLMAASLVRIMSICFLTSLELDTAETGFIDAGNSLSMHLCNNIKDLLPTLRRLRCRMRMICPDILKPRGPLRHLQDVVINLNVPDIPEYPDYTPLGSIVRCFPRRCGIHAVGTFDLWAADMERQAKKLVRRMSNPRLVRVVSRAEYDNAVYSFDALTGRRMLIGDDAPWDADGGEVVEEAETEHSANAGPVGAAT